MARENSVGLAITAIMRDYGSAADHHVPRMHGRIPDRITLLLPFPLMAEKNRRESLISVGHDFEKIERAIASK